MKQIQKAAIIEAMYKAFIYGWGFGEAKLEEDMDNNYFDAFLQSFASNTIGGGSAPCHTVALPNTIEIVRDKNGQLKTISTPDFNGKYVRYKLRSDKWREARLNDKAKFEKELDKLIRTLKL